MEERMKNVFIFLVLMVSFIYAEADSAKAEPKVKVTPIIVAEFLAIQEINPEADAGSLIFGTNEFGATVATGPVDVVASINLNEDLSVSVNKAYITHNMKEKFTLTAGYKNIPFGYWTTNCVNYPLVRTGGIVDAVKEKAIQLEFGAKNDLVDFKFAGYNNNGTFQSFATKATLDYNVIGAGVSMKLEDFDQASLDLALLFDLDVVTVTASYYTGLNHSANGGYAEVSVLPNDNVIVSARAGMLTDRDLSAGDAQFSLAGLYFLNKYVALGLEYTAFSPIADSKLQTPEHWATGLIAFIF